MRLLILPIRIILTLSTGVAIGAPADADRGFGANGRAVVDFGGSDDVHAMAVQPDGKILVAGYTSIKADAAVARLNPDGFPDRRFRAARRPPPRAAPASGRRSSAPRGATCSAGPAGGT
jgi:hypothetical protein